MSGAGWKLLSLKYDLHALVTKSTWSSTALLCSRSGTNMQACIMLTPCSSSCGRLTLLGLHMPSRVVLLMSIHRS